MRKTYVGLAVLGTVLPWLFFARFLLDYGLDVPEMLAQAFANDISTFFVLDVLISGVVLLIFVFHEGARAGLDRLWRFVAGTLLVGVSLGLPAFLAAREESLDDDGG